MYHDPLSERNIVYAASASGEDDNQRVPKWNRPQKKRGIGRPQKYAMVLWSLEDDVLYTAATVANRAMELQLTSAGSPKRLELERQRIRIAMGRYVNNHAFPDNGDGNVRLRGQAPTPGWYGRRWKAHADPLDDKQYRRLVRLLTEAGIEDDQLIARIRRSEY